MPMYPLRYKPTIDVEQTPSLNKQGLSASSLIRFREGLVEALLGWVAVCTQAVTGVARAMHFWTDLSGVSRFAIGTNEKLYLFPSVDSPTSPLIDITPISGYTPGTVSSGSIPYSLQIWSLDNFGEFLIGVPSHQGLFIWMPEQGNTPATLINALATLTGGEITPGVAPWQSITDGGFAVAVAGTIQNITGLNFSAVTTLTQIAAIIQAGMTGTSVTGVVTSDGNWQFVLEVSSPNATLSYANAPTGAGVTDISSMLAWTSTTAELLAPGGPPPAQNQGQIVLDQIQMIFAYGCTPVGGGAEDAMLTRWCDQSDYQDWVASTTNQAGSYRIPHGSRIVGALQVPGMAVLWTDVGVWAVQYIGFPLVFSFQNIGQNCGLISEKSAVVLGQMVYWMSDHGFFNMAGGGPQQIPCPIWDIVYKNLDDANRDKCVGGTDYHYSEIWWFYPSINGNTGEIDSYVKVNIESNSWDYGPATPNANDPASPGTPNQFSRTAWTDQNQPGSPVSVDLTGLMQQMDQGFTANGAPIVGGLVQSGYTDIAQGEGEMAVDQFMPDFLWGGSDPELQLSLLFRSYPNEAPTIMGPFTITPQTEYVTLRKPTTINMPDKTAFTAWPAVRGREVAVEIATVSGWWRWGNPRMRAAKAGRLP